MKEKADIANRTIKIQIKVSTSKGCQSKPAPAPISSKAEPASPFNLPLFEVALAPEIPLLLSFFDRGWKKIFSAKHPPQQKAPSEEETLEFHLPKPAIQSICSFLNPLDALHSVSSVLKAWRTEVLRCICETLYNTKWTRYFRFLSCVFPNLPGSFKPSEPIPLSFPRAVSLLKPCCVPSSMVSSSTPASIISTRSPWSILFSLLRRLPWLAPAHPLSYRKLFAPSGPNNSQMQIFHVQQIEALIFMAAASRDVLAAKSEHDLLYLAEYPISEETKKNLYNTCYNLCMSQNDSPGSPLSAENVKKCLYAVLNEHFEADVLPELQLRTENEKQRLKDALIREEQEELEQKRKEEEEARLATANPAAIRADSDPEIPRALDAPNVQNMEEKDVAGVHNEDSEEQDEDEEYFDAVEEITDTDTGTDVFFTDSDTEDGEEDEPEDEEEDEPIEQDSKQREESYGEEEDEEDDDDLEAQLEAELRDDRPGSGVLSHGRRYHRQLEQFSDLFSHADPNFIEFGMRMFHDAVVKKIQESVMLSSPLPEENDLLQQ